MELAIHQLSALLIDKKMTEQQFTDEVLFLKEYPIYSILVLPYHVARAKQLVEGTTIKISSLIDFPLGNGTEAKKAFETAHLFHDGASELFATLSLSQLNVTNHQIYRALENLLLGYGELGLFLDLNQKTDQRKSELVSVLLGLNASTLLLGNELNVEQAIHGLSLFSTSKGLLTEIQVNMNKPTLLEIALLFQAGAARVGIVNGREILPLAMSKQVSREN